VGGLAKHEKKALTIVVDIHHHIYKLRCKDKSQVHMHLETQMQGQLAWMCVGLPDTDHVMVILGSLLKSYWPLINAILMSVTHSKVSLIPEKVIESLLDKLD